MKLFDFDARGEAGKPTVVLLHSSAGSSRQWGALVERLGAHYDVRTVDVYGHGAQPAWSWKRPLRLADDAALVEPIVREVGSVHLVGHSYGGAVALKVAEMHPQAVRSVVAYEPPLFRWLFDDDIESPAAREVISVAEDLRRSMHHRNYSAGAERFLDYWGGTGTWASMSAERRQAAAGRMSAVLPHFAAVADDAPTVLGLRRVPAPMLFVEGGATVASTRRICGLLRAALPQAIHERMPDIGHMGPVTHAQVVNVRIEQFLRTLVEARRTADGTLAVA